MVRKVLGYFSVLLLIASFTACSKSKPKGKAVVSDQFMVEAAPQTSLKAQKEGSNFPVKEFKLSNGLQVFFSKNTQSPEFYAEIIVKSGSKHEDPDATGLAHYLEHLMFKGTSRIGTANFSKENEINQKIIAKYEEKKNAKSEEEKQKIIREIDQLSVEAAQYVITGDYDKLLTAMGQTHINAHTSFEETVYHIQLPKNRFEQWARVQKEVFTDPQITRTFQWELEVVYEEKNSRARPMSELFNKVRARLFPNHGLGRSIIGETDHLKNPSIKRTIDFFKKHYVTGNMAIAVAGDLELEEVRSTLEKTFGQIPSKPAPPYNPPPLAPIEERVVETYTFDVAPSFIAAFRIPGVNSEDYEALQVMDSILANGNIGIIDTLNTQRKVYRAGSGVMFNANHGIFYVHGGVKENDQKKPIQSHEEVEKQVLAVLDKVKKGEFSDELLAAVKVNFANENAAINEKNSSRVNMIRDSVINGLAWDHVLKYADRIQSVTREDVMRVAKKYLSGGYVVGQMHRGQGQIEQVEKPKITPIAGKTAKGPSPEVKKFIAEKVPVIEPNFVDMGKMVETAKSSKATYYVAENPMNDKDAISIQFDFGAYTNAKACELISFLSEAGTSKVKSTDIKKSFYKMAITGYKIGCGTESTTITFSVLTGQLEQALKLIGEILSDPKVNPAQFKFLTAEGLKAVEQSRKKSDTAVSSAVSLFLFGEDSAYKHLLTKEELLQLKAEEVGPAVKELLQYPVTVEYSGKKSLGEIQDLIEKSIPLADKKKVAVKRKNLSVAKVNKPTLYFYHVPNERQAKIRLLYPSEKYAAGQFKNDAIDRIFSLYYANGGLSTVLMTELREKRSLSYGAYGSYPFSRRTVGDIRVGDDTFFLGQIDTQSDKFVEAITAFTGLMKNMIWNKQGFDSAKSSYKSGLGGAMSFRSKPMVYRIWQDLGYTSNPNVQRYKEIDGITMEMVAERLEKNISSKSPVIIVVGDEAKIDFKPISGEYEIKKLSKEQLYPKL